MSPKIEDFPDRDRFAEIDASEDFILLRVTEDGHVTTISTLDEDDAVDLLRMTADAIEAEGFERQRVARPS
jgi:type IV secretory pathway ATPase VirB11/archaellum biosynthesis ATPase